MTPTGASLHVYVVACGALVLALAATAPLLSQEEHARHHAVATRPDRPGSVPGRMAIPDVALRNQDGDEVRFYSDLVRGRVVAVNTIFTTCTTICPPMGANFSRLESLMKGRLDDSLRLISISVDPTVDTPQRLKAWGDKFDAGPRWTLLTGSKSEVDKLLKALKVFTPDKYDHTPVVLIGNEPTGSWTRTYGLASPDELAETLLEVSAEKTARVVEGSGR